MKTRHIAAAVLSAVWILGTYKGRVALWQEGGTLPVRVFPYSIATLPRVDQQALENGIPISDPGELAHLLEDYLS